MKTIFAQNPGLTRKNLGFTLIELLVVISIIALLSSVVLAALQSARNKAKVSAFQQEVKQFILATELYKTDNDGQLPLISFGSHFGDNFSNTDFDNNFGQYLLTFPVPPIGDDNTYLFFEADGTYGPFNCNGVDTDVVLVLTTSPDLIDEYRLEDLGWGLNLEDNSESYDGYPCIAL